RIPFMRAGAVPLALTFALLWLPPRGMAEWAAALYLAVVSSLFFAFFTLYVAPYLALLPELSRSAEERLSLAGWQAGFNIAGLIVGGVAAAAVIGAYGFGAMGVIFGAAALASLVLPAWFLPRTRISERPGVETGLWESIRLTWANAPFRIYVIAQVLFWIAFYMVMAGAPYLVSVIMGGSEDDAGIALVLALFMALLSFPGIMRLSKRWGLKNAFAFTMAWFVLVLIAWGLVGRIGGPLNAWWQGIVVFALAGVPLAGLFILPNALVAEITDIDEARTGQRREAVYFGVQGLLVKTGAGLAAVLATSVIQTFGYSQEASAGVSLLGPISAVIVLAGLAVFRRYPAQAITGPSSSAALGL